MSNLTLSRSVLFTPADRPERFAKAIAAGADGAVLDLEDGVGLSGKDDARRAALTFFAAPVAAPAKFLWALRLNHVSTVHGLRDLLALREAKARPQCIVLPKTESLVEVEIAVCHLSDRGAPPRIIALIETARGLSAAEAIAAHPAVDALAFGGAELPAHLGAELGWEQMLYARSRIVQAAATASIAAFDVPFLDIHDTDGLRRATESAKALGYTCKFAIHPAQVTPINDVFTPGPDELARARKIVAALESAGGGACQVDGRMVDAPVVKSARRIVALAAR